MNAVTTSDIRTVGEALSSKQNEGWKKAISEDLQALEDNEVCKIVKTPKIVRPLTFEWVFKTTHDAEGDIERLEASLVACGNEQVFGVNFGVTFAAVIDMFSVKTVFALARNDIFLQFSVIYQTPM